MAGNLTDLSEAELLEFVMANPAIYRKVVASDGRVQLMERLYADKDAKRAMQQHSKRLFPKAEIPEIDLAADLRKELEPDFVAIKETRKELEERNKAERRRDFVRSMIEHGAHEDDVQKIEQFMLDNEIGPKSLGLAVQQYYDSSAAAEPTATAHSFALPENDQMRALLSAPPGADLDEINAPFVESIFNEMTGGSSKKRRPMVTA